MKIIKLIIIINLLCYGCQNPNSERKIAEFKKSFISDKNLSLVIKDCRSSLDAKDSHKKIVFELQELVKNSNITRGRALTKDNLFTIFLINDLVRFRLEINSTIDGKTFVNFFQHVKNNYYSFKGRVYITENECIKLKDLISNYCCLE